MGEVYRAVHSKLRREVAIKVLPPDLALDPGRISRFEREARTASALNHPNIVTIHDIGEHDGTMFIAMELVAGRTRMWAAGAGRWYIVQAQLRPNPRGRRTMPAHRRWSP